MENNGQSQKNTGRRFGSILWPLILIAFGILLLFDTLGLLERSLWDILWNLWPLIFIAIGLDSLLRKKEIFGPVFWFGLGGLFLFSNFGYLGVGAWNTLFQIWPMLLVTAGLEIMLGKRSLWISLIVTIGLLTILIFAITFNRAGSPAQTAFESTIVEPLGTANNSKISIAMGAGKLNIYPLLDADTLISGELSMGGNQIRTQSTMQGNTKIYSVEQTNPLIVPFDNSWQWEFGLNTQVPLDITPTMGAGSMNLSLDELILTDLLVEMGVGELEVIMPDGEYNVEINQAIGQVVVEIPDDIPIRFEINRAISNLSLPDNFEKQNEYYYSPGARETEAIITIQIEQAIGNIVISYQK